MPTAEVDIANRAFDLSNKIKEAFLNDNKKMLKNLCSKDLYNDLSRDIDSYTGEGIDFTMRWVDIDEEGTIHLYVSWKKKDKRKTNDENTSGMAVFIIKDKPFIAKKILRENPFSD
ncbi:MAG TPA: hypothetical protein ENG86_07350 [Nitrospirae bacterium]|nr:hypothetical protein [Nitrospirota bacterium]HDO22656.1 hypothetical protein [Nitrospirota bacterium]